MNRSKKMPPIHPGEILKEEILTPRKISQTKLAQGINVAPKIVSEICQKKRNIDAEMALRLGTYFEINAQFWMNLPALWFRSQQRLIWRTNQKRSSTFISS